jgi:hypothetical protein
MANIPETSTFTANIPEIATTDAALGGDETKPANKQAKALADRTQWLKDQVTTLASAVAALAGLNSPVLTGDPTAPTPPIGDDDDSIATTHFVHIACGGVIVLDVSGNSNVTVPQDHWGCGVIMLGGAITDNINVIFPNRVGIGDRWLVANRTTGPYQITCKTAAGAGVKVAQARSKDIWTDGTDVLDAQTDLSIRPKKITGAYTAAAGDSLIIDQTGGTFATALPAGPSMGDTVDYFGQFKSTNHTIGRNGQMTYDATGAAVAANILLNRNNLHAKVVFDGVAWMAT